MSNASLQQMNDLFGVFSNGTNFPRAPTDKYAYGLGITPNPLTASHLGMADPENLTYTLGACRIVLSSEVRDETVYQSATNRNRG